MLGSAMLRVLPPAKTVFQGIQQAVESGVGGLYLMNGRHSVHGNGAGVIVRFRCDLRTKPSRRLKLSSLLIVLERHCDYIEQPWSDEAEDHGWSGTDVQADDQVLDPSGSQFEQSPGMGEWDICHLLNRTAWSTRDQDEMTRMSLHLRVGASIRPIREVALLDRMPSPRLLDQPSQGGGEQKDAGSAHRISLSTEEADQRISPADARLKRNSSRGKVVHQHLRFRKTKGNEPCQALQLLIFSSRRQGHDSCREANNPPRAFMHLCHALSSVGLCRISAGLQ